MTALDVLRHWRRERALEHLVRRHWLAVDLDRPADTILNAISGRAARPRSKGEPDLHALQEALLDTIRSQSHEPTDMLALLESARRLAALDMGDSDAFALSSRLFANSNMDVLARLRAAMKPWIVAHITCVPRLDRALASCESFERPNAPYSQLMVVGGGFDSPYAFDEQRRILSVPSSDAYEHLPGKIVAASALLAHLPQVAGLLKLDDDHRLADFDALRARFSLPQGRPLQRGHVYRSRYLGDQKRYWHMGKCEDAALNEAPYGLIGIPQWVTGQAGYFLNRPALKRLHWASVYFAAFVRTAVYEDVALGELLPRLGGRLQHIPIRQFIGTVDRY